jgi:hypothetical protein
MDFNWIFINPIQQSGHSRSLYSIKDYYAIDTRMLEPAGGLPEEQVRAMVALVRRAGMGLMMDLVINHTAFDSPLVREHPEWYRRGPSQVTHEPVSLTTLSAVSFFARSKHAAAVSSEVLKSLPISRPTAFAPTLIFSILAAIFLASRPIVTHPSPYAPVASQAFGPLAAT